MNIDFSSANQMQVLKGWGTSACWWSQYCTGKAADDIAGLLYGDDGLRLNIYRYNVGAGTDINNCRVKNPWRTTESFMLYDREKEQTSWDFSRDKNAVDMMKKCLALGNIDTVILFANSPHYSQTSTGQASGSLLYHTCNIPKSKYEAFADYFLTVTEHFLSEGIRVDYISPINEPQWKWGGSFVWQEGCHYETQELIEIYRIFSREILKRGLPVKLYGPESGAMLEYTDEYLDAMLSDELIMKTLGVFAYHSYHNDDDPEMRAKFKKEIVEPNPNLRFDMSEWCELPNKSHTENFKGALITARIIGQDIIYGGAESWTSWVAVNQNSIRDDGFDYSDGLITADDHFGKWSIAQRYYGFAHFSKYIPVGSTALDIGIKPSNGCNDFNVFAFRTPQGKTVIEIVNEGKERSLSVDGMFDKMRIIASTADYKLKELFRGSFKTDIHVSENSIVTVILWQHRRVHG